MCGAAFSAKRKLRHHLSFNECSSQEPPMKLVSHTADKVTLELSHHEPHLANALSRRAAYRMIATRLRARRWKMGFGQSSSGLKKRRNLAWKPVVRIRC